MENNTIKNMSIQQRSSEEDLPEHLKKSFELLDTIPKMDIMEEISKLPKIYKFFTLKHKTKPDTFGHFDRSLPNIISDKPFPQLFFSKEKLDYDLKFHEDHNHKDFLSELMEYDIVGVDMVVTKKY